MASDHALLLLLQAKDNLIQRLPMDTIHFLWISFQKSNHSSGTIWLKRMIPVINVKFVANFIGYR